MIGRLKGTVTMVDQASTIVDVAGVGYEVSLAPRHVTRLVEGDRVTLVIETLVAETFIRLVGFESAAERQAFRLLQTVQGVGAKAALAILDVLPPTALAEAIAIGDKTAVARAQGVGPKLAARVVSELSGKIGSALTAVPLSPGPGGPRSAAPGHAGGSGEGASVRRDAAAALVSLGYDEPAALRAIAAVPAQAEETTEAVVTAALRGLAAA